MPPRNERTKMQNRINNPISTPPSSMTRASELTASDSNGRIATTPPSREAASTFEHIARRKPHEASPLTPVCRPCTGSESATKSRGFAERVAGEMGQNWPGYTFMGMLGFLPGLAIGAPALTVAGAMAAPVLMGVHFIRRAETAYGPGVDGNGNRC